MYLKPLTFQRNLILFLFLILALGCAAGTTQSPPGTTQSQVESPKATALKALLADKQIYEATFKSLALLDSQGKLPRGVKVKAIDLGNKYLAAHNLAVQVLLDNGAPSMAGVKAAFDTFIVFAAPYASGVK